MKKFSFITAVFSFALIAVTTSCKKTEIAKPAPPVNQNTNKFDTVFKTSAGNTITAIAGGSAYNAADSVITMRVDSSGVTILVEAFAIYNGNTALAIFFLRPASQSSAIDIANGTSGVVFEQNLNNNNNNETIYQSGLGIPGTSGTFTIISNDIENKKISGTFDKVVAANQTSNADKITINNGSFSLSY